MANLKVILRKCAVFTQKKPAISFTQQTAMSQYPSFYIKPVYKKEMQEELEETGEAQKLSHVPTRAALIDQTSSYVEDPEISLFTNYLMRHGNKILARELVQKTFERIKRIQLEKYHKCKDDEEKKGVQLNPRAIFNQAVVNCKPVLHLTPIKRGGVKYLVPVPISERKSRFTAMNWLIDAGNEKERDARFIEKLAQELIDASNNTGRVVKKKQELHKQCEANRAYAHYRWS